MEKINKLLFYIPEKIINVLWIVNFVIIAGSIIANVFIYNMMNQIKDAEVYIKFYPAFAVIATVIMLSGQIKKITFKNLTLIAYFLAAVISVYSAYRFISYLNFNYFISKNNLYILLICVCVVLFEIIATVLALGCKYAFCSSYLPIKLTESGIVSFVLAFVIFIFVPSQSFFGNFTDYAFPYSLLLKSLLVDFIFWFCIGTLLLPLLKKIYYYAILYGLTGMLIAVYFQYLFMNSAIGTIDGTTFDWKTNTIGTVTNCIIWLLFICVPVIAGVIKRKAFRKVFIFVNVFIGLIHLITYSTILLQADHRCYEYSASYFTYENQYRLAKNNNIIIFILDAVDNKMIDELYENKREIFDDYKDFTIYTNTCSVYDHTSRSILQMVTNVEFDNTKNNIETREMAWTSPSCVEYYKRLHDGGYQVEYYNLYNEKSVAVVDKFDNAHLFDQEAGKPRNISYKMIRENVINLAKYTLYPNIMKNLVDVSELTFTDVILYADSKGYHENDEFESNLNLELADMDDCVRYYHLAGAHTPNDNIETVEYCFDILSNYMNQMKDMGVYDNSTIIITADHGLHDYCETKGPETIKASTPMFMIKEANSSYDEAQFNDAPIYHRDLIPTILYSAGLYENGDKELFGTTIYDYSEGDLRTRVWYDRVRDVNYPMTGTWNTYYGFEFVGDTEEFERVVEEKENLVIYPEPMMHD